MMREVGNNKRQCEELCSEAIRSLKTALSKDSLWALGLMSGTSADGVDAALLRTDGVQIHDFGPTHFLPYPDTLKHQILQAYGHPPGRETASLSKAITEHHALVVRQLLKKSNTPVDLIGFHGQTLFHRPPLHKGEKGETHQIGDGHLLASLLRIPVVDQFRLNDMAHGGQGAPLVPLFHQALVKDLQKPIAILNIGGVSNLTWIGIGENDLIAFDVGPGNGLMDDWIRKHTGLPWDDKGKIAAKGKIDQTLLDLWLSHQYFSQNLPKSLDRQTFHGCLEDLNTLSLESGLATLTAFTAASCEKALAHLPQRPSLCLVAGGGARNLTLVGMIEQKLQTPIRKAFEQGYEEDSLEAQAFAFLAVRSLKGLSLTLPKTTGVPYPLTGGRLCPVAFGLS